MNILERLASPVEWELYYEHKLSQGNLSDREAEELRGFIHGQEYMPAVKRIQSGETFPPPVKKLIGKSGSTKKRAVYSFGREENYILKLIAFMLRDYDGLFAPNLYSFRKDVGVRTAMNKLLGTKNLSSYYAYKADISDYFGSVDIGLLLPELKEALSDDPRLFEFIRGLLECPFVLWKDELVRESKGIMAGVPISGFLADLYLCELDFYFHERGIPYMRYSDDIILFADSMEELNGHIGYIADALARRGLRINTAKESVTRPREQWSFLGFSYKEGVVDICPVSLRKLKAKMRRKTRALSRWAARKGVCGTVAARAFVKRFNSKLYDNPVYSELTWSRWFFPVINTDRSLRLIDAYMQECIRYLATGKRTKARFDFRYEDIKALGYRSLVNEYYKWKDMD